MLHQKKIARKENWEREGKIEGEERKFLSLHSFTWIIIVASVSFFSFFTLEMFPPDELLLLFLFLLSLFFLSLFPTFFLGVILMGETGKERSSQERERKRSIA